jgi:hypothetical protein
MYCSNKKCVNHEGVSHMQGYMQGDPPRWVKSSSANNIQPISEKIETFDPIHDVPGTDEQVQIAFADANNPLKVSIMSENSLNLTVQQQVWLAVYVALADKHVSPCCAALANEAVEEFGKAFPVYRSSQIEDSQ